MKTPRPLVLTGGRIVTPAGVAPGAVRCVDGRIAALGWVISAAVFLGAYAAIPGEALFRVSTAFALGTAVAVPLLGYALLHRRRDT